MSIANETNEIYRDYPAHFPEIVLAESLSFQPPNQQTTLCTETITTLSTIQQQFLERLTAGYQQTLQALLLSKSTENKISEASHSAFPGPAFSREDLEVLASGKISSKFGEWFSELDQYQKLIRMPEPPLLLADRVLGIDAKPASFETGTIWTETDIKTDSWYLHQGRMPSGIMIESGQADLLLISWLGFDFYNRGERVYRLLGCELTFYGQLPKPGETLRFDIHVDSHAKLGDVRLFFFHYDCHVGTQCRMQVRRGQAGFFTYEELENSGGVLWSPEEGDYDKTKLVQQPDIFSEYTQFDHEKLVQLSNGLAAECLGEKFNLLKTHTRTPTLPSGKMLLINAVTHFDLTGGPWKRGYMRAVQKIQPNDWFFQGHFKNDPCMPGTLMLEAGLQVMMCYMIASGCTLDKDGWRFEPVPEETYKLTCRGQVIPRSKEVVYEIFIYGFEIKPRPVLYADLLGTVDGLKAFHTKIGLRLVPDWPLLQEINRTFSYDYYSLLACALGKPSDAFGKMYECFDEGKRVARLPAPPYHFISRIIDINAIQNSLNPCAEITVEWDIDPNGWYFDKNPSHTVPYCVLLEAGLQPCGWLASYLGCALTADEELFYRNLDGTAKVIREITPTDSVLRTVVQCKSLSRLSGTIIISFTVKNYILDELISEMDTVFGFFPQASFENQAGLPASEEEKNFIHLPSNDIFPLTELSPNIKNQLPQKGLLMLDRITGLWPNINSAGETVIRAEKTVDPSEWFFKAHFFQDPVQPGSLGVEAVLQVMQYYAVKKYTPTNFDNINVHIEPIANDSLISWKYRGQVTPRNQLIKIFVKIISEVEEQENQENLFSVLITASASLWCDDKKLYELPCVSIRIRETHNTNETQGDVP